MRTTLALDDDLLAEAQRLTGVKEKTALVRLALEALIARERPAPGPTRRPRTGPARDNETATRPDVILVDTSVWVDHLRHGDSALVSLLSRDEVLCHPWVIGELALGPCHKGPKSSAC
jgi:Arc/MetJ family transcription regulator